MDISANVVSDAYQAFHLSGMHIFNKHRQVHIQPKNVNGNNNQFIIGLLKL